MWFDATSQDTFVNLSENDCEQLAIKTWSILGGWLSMIRGNTDGQSDSFIGYSFLTLGHEGGGHWEIEAPAAMCELSQD